MLNLEDLRKVVSKPLEHSLKFQDRLLRQGGFPVGGPVETVRYCCNTDIQEGIGVFFCGRNVTSLQIPGIKTRNICLLHC